MILGGVACAVGASESLGMRCHPAIEIGEIMLDKRPLTAALLTLTLAVGGAGIAYAEQYVGTATATAYWDCR